MTTAGGAGPAVTRALSDPLRHNAWATRELLAFCARLTSQQLGATATGTYGTILATLQHMLGAESRYLFRVSGEADRWPRRPEETAEIEELSAMADDLAAGWEKLLSGEFDPDRTINAVDLETGEPWESNAGLMVAQTLNHGNEHRAQIATILTTIGVEPPNLDGWSYGEATGRFRMLPPDTP